MDQRFWIWDRHDGARCLFWIWDRRRSEIVVAVWVWVDDRVTEEEDLDGGGKGLFLQLGFWVEVTDLDEDGDES